MQQLAVGTTQSYNKALDIYSRGAFSDSIAVLTLGAPTTSDLSVSTEVIGFATGMVDEVKGTLLDNYPTGTKIIRVKYHVNQVQSNFVGCQVGANPDPKTVGCFAESGELVVSGYSGNLNYTYDILSDNVNGRTIKGFSTQARQKMYLCDNCPYVDYMKVSDYSAVCTSPGRR